MSRTARPCTSCCTRNRTPSAGLPRSAPERGAGLSTERGAGLSKKRGAGLSTERGGGPVWAKRGLDRALRQGLGALIRGKAGGRFFEDIIKDVAHLVALDRAVA